jgi:hypothetical protein
VSAYFPLAEEAAQLLEEAPNVLNMERLLFPTFDWPDSWNPQWEEFGRKRVSEGRFALPITYNDHVLGIAKALLGRNAGRL